MKTSLAGSSRDMKLRRIVFLTLFLLPALVSCRGEQVEKAPKYVFLMMGDGMGISVTFNTGFYRGGPEALPSFVSFPVRGFLTNCSANSLVTDSSAAASAMFSGVKTDNGRAGTMPDDSPVESVLQQARRLGFGAGMVTTNGINHATPAAVCANVVNRKRYDEAAGQMLSSDFDFLAGSTVLSAEADGRDRWLAEAAGKGWNVFVGKNACRPCDGKVLYVADKDYDGDLAYAIDRRPDDVALEDFTRAAMDHLQSHYAEEGFVLLVEGGSIDHACHSNDAKTAFEEVLDFEKSVNIVMEFAAAHPGETLVIVCADHDTGGLAMSGNYDCSLLDSQKASMSEVTARLSALRNADREVSWEQVKAVLRETLGYWDGFQPGAGEENRLLKIYAKSFKGKMGPVKDLYHTNEPLAVEAVTFLSGKAGFRWTCHSHDSSPVPYFVTGTGCERFNACRDNTDIARTLREVMGWE